MNKKTFIIISVLLLIAIIGVGVYLIVQNNQKPEVNEILPEEEISDEQMRQTIVTLYYQNKETKALMPEGRSIDAKELLTDPYTTLMNLLIETPKNEKLQTAIPTGTRVLKAELKGDMIWLDLSKEFIDNHSGGQEAENTTIYAIVNTLTELKEVNSVKILINGKENQSFKDEKINFKNAFVRIEKENTNPNKETNNNTVTNKSNEVSNNTTTNKNENKQ